jgi:hypothetical protein
MARIVRVRSFVSVVKSATSPLSGFVENGESRAGSLEGLVSAMIQNDQEGQAPTISVV